MNTTSSILIGIDFSTGSAAALREAVRIAKWNRATLRAVHVIDALVAAELEEALSEFQKRVREELLEDARRAWVSLAATVEGADAVPIEVRIDNRDTGILAAAREIRADLIVMGASGDRDPDIGQGTVASAAVRHAMCNVLLVREAQPGPFKTVVACVDFSPTSLRALDQAARVATQDGAALHVLHVFEAPWHQLHYRSPTLEADPHFQKQYRDGLERRLRAFAAELGRGIDYLKPAFALFDHAGHRSGIVTYAGRIDADLIVLGTRGRTNLRDVLVGSTAEKALRDSRCSVLAVKPEGFTHPLAVGLGVPQAQMRALF